jgi:hypothetical protein
MAVTRHLRTSAAALRKDLDDADVREEKFGSGQTRCADVRKPRWEADRTAIQTNRASQVREGF